MMPVGDAKPNYKNKFKKNRTCMNKSVSKETTPLYTPSCFKELIVDFLCRLHRRKSSITETVMWAVDVFSSIPKHFFIALQVHHKINANLLVDLQIIGFLGSSLRKLNIICVKFSVINAS